jgi:DNA-binding transcriptional MerR regulator
MRIGELSRRTGVTVRLLRYYEQQGLLSPQRASSGYRLYSESDVERVERIRCMLGLGVPTRVIRRINMLLHGPKDGHIEPQQAAVILHEVESEMQTLDERLAELRRNRDRLETFAQHVRRRAAAG